MIKFIKFFNNLGIMNPDWLSSFSVSTLQILEHCCQDHLGFASLHSHQISRATFTCSSLGVHLAQNLPKSAKPLIRLLFNLCSPDIGSQTGQNINYLLQKNSKQTLTELVNDRNIVKKTILTPISETESWKLKIIEEVSLVRKGQLEADFDDLMLDEILDYICTV